MPDLIIRNANLPDGRQGVDIAVENGKITRLAAGMQETAASEIDATGRLATPSFVESHFHLE